MINRKALVMSVMVGAVLLFTIAPASAKTSRLVNLSRPGSLNGTLIVPGRYKVTWESHSARALITFSDAKTHKVVATGEGKLVDRGAPYENNSIVYETKADGSAIIVEMRFAGMSSVIVFGEGS